MTDTYDKQIEALLAEDYDGFISLLAPKFKTHNAIVENHTQAWMVTGDLLGGSLFAFLEGSPHCASTIEHHSGPKDSPLLYAKLIEGSKVSLPDMDGVDMDGVDMDGVHQDSFKFTREQLEEFARRQRVAREPVDG